MVFQVDPTRSSLLLKAKTGNLLPQAEPGSYQQQIELGLVGQTVRSGQPVLVNDVPQSGDIVFAGEVNVRSALVVPLSVGTQVEAVICVARDIVNGFTDQDLWTLSSLGSQTAIAVKNAWLDRSLDAYSDTLERTIEARTQRLQAINKISQLVSQRLEIDELLSVVREGIGQIFATEAIDDVQVRIGLRNGANLVINRVLTIKIESETQVGQVITGAKSKLLTNVTLDNFYQPLPGTEGKAIESLLMAPLVTGGKVIGLIMVESQTPLAFDDSDLEILETLAFQVASAIEHARLLQKTREIAIGEERTRLARDMHDGIAQNLAYLLIQIDRGLNMVEEGSKLETQLEQISSLLKQNIDELRRNIFDLRPVDLEGKSIFAVLEKFLAEFGRRWNLRTAWQVRGEGVEMSPEVESSLYRILQEALSNAQQHAQCTKVSVKVEVMENRWVGLELVDDGLGFKLGQVHQGHGRQQGKGLGLTSMRERAESVGGEFAVESVPGRGTRVFAKLPLRMIIPNIEQGGGKI
jgi:signal transduction histidine kinase